MSRTSSSVTGSRWALGSPPGQPHQQVGRPRQHPDQGPGDQRDGGQGAGGQLGPALGALQGDPLGGELAQHQRHIGEHDGDHHDRSRLSRPTKEAQRLDQRLGQRHGRDRRGQEPGQGDPDLDGGQELVGVASQPGHQPAPAALGLQAPQLALPQRDEGDLAAGEGRVDQHQHHDQADL